MHSELTSAREPSASEDDDSRAQTDGKRSDFRVLDLPLPGRCDLGQLFSLSGPSYLFGKSNVSQSRGED